MENYRLFISFLEGSNYMFEFDFHDLKKLFMANPEGSGRHAMSKGRILKVKGSFYEIESLEFELFPHQEENDFNARLNVHIHEVEGDHPLTEDVITVPDELVENSSKKS